MTLLIKGNTYTARRDLAKLGCVYSYDHGGYVGDDIPEIHEIAERLGYDIEHIEHIEINEAYVVSQKNARAQKKAEKYLLSAESLHEQSEKSSISQQERDFLVLAEPIKIGHHSEKRHRRLVEKAWNDMGKRVELSKKAQEMEQKAEYWKNQRYTTTEEKETKKEKARKIYDLATTLWIEQHKIGDEYIGWHTSFIIAKINKKTVSSPTGSKGEISYSKDFEKYTRLAAEKLYK